MSNASRFVEQQKNKINNRNGTNMQTTKPEQSSNKLRVDDDGSTLGVYMTMDELAELVKAVKNNAKSKTKDFFFRYLFLQYFLDENNTTVENRGRLKNDCIKICIMF